MNRRRPEALLHCGWGILATLSDYLPRTKVTTALGHLTFFASLGQISGPSLAGSLVDLSGSFSSNYLLAAVLSAGAAVMALLLLKRDTASTVELAIESQF